MRRLGHHLSFPLPLSFLPFYSINGACGACVCGVCVGGVCVCVEEAASSREEEECVEISSGSPDCWQDLQEGL